MCEQYMKDYAACPWNASDPTNQTYYDNVYRKCTLDCPANPTRYKSYSTATRTCLQYCETGYYALDTNRSCVAVCPNYYFINNTLNVVIHQCVAQCPNNTFLDTSSNHCVKSTACPPNYYGNPVNGQCTLYCPIVNGVQMFANMNPNVKMCVYSCPPNYYMQN